jgi:hypothetical protein
MNEDTSHDDHAADEHPKGLLSQHPRLGILLIAGIFYLILFGMCGFALLIILQGRS